jgi:predicted RNase H-like nuclease (RuvC/YqgF family)
MADGNDLTPNVTLIPEPGSVQEALTGNQETEEQGKGEQSEAPKPEETIDYWKERYNASSRGAEDISRREKEARQALMEKESAINAVAREKAELERRLQDEQPESYERYKIEQELESLKKDVVLQKEARAIDEFISQRPEASGQREALKAYGRTNPNKSYGELYDSFIKPIYEAGVKEAEAKIQVKKQSQPETGRGSVEKAPSDSDIEDFNSLSLDERRRKFKQMGL